MSQPANESLLEARISMRVTWIRASPRSYYVISSCTPRDRMKSDRNSEIKKRLECCFRLGPPNGIRIGGIVHRSISRPTRADSNDSKSFSDDVTGLPETQGVDNFFSPGKSG